MASGRQMMPLLLLLRLPPRLPWRQLQLRRATSAARRAARRCLG
jgi:hypothetical protein